MTAIVAECVRYFQRPSCFRMPPDHVHTSRCWDDEFQAIREDLINAESDIQALTRVNKQLKQENFHLKEKLRPSRTTAGVRGQSPSWVSMDEASIWDKIKDFGDVDEETVRKAAAELLAKPTNVESDGDIHLRRISMPDGMEGFQTADGKVFTHKSQAARHAVLLRKRP